MAILKDAILSIVIAVVAIIGIEPSLRAMTRQRSIQRLARRPLRQHRRRNSGAVICANAARLLRIR